MKKRLLKFVLPISLGLMLAMITLFGLISTTFVSCGLLDKCAAGELKGNDGDCYACSAGAHATYAYEGAGCSNPVSGVYCCPGGGSTGCQPKTGCPTWASWLGGDGYCYATSAACHAGQTSDYHDDNTVCRQCN
jgi:hypothetical protein